MNKYGLAAIGAAKLCRDEAAIGPAEAWQIIVAKLFPDSPSSREKCCPRDAFLALCEEGHVIGVERGNYTRSRKNRKYALDALKALQHDPTLTAESLWTLILGGEAKRHNSQMDVVLSLQQSNLLRVMPATMGKS
jgi:hypothetical protein